MARPVLAAPRAERDVLFNLSIPVLFSYDGAMKVSILGAGELGATIAQKLAQKDWAGEVFLMDLESGPPEGKALDLLEANPVLGSGTVLRGSHDLTDVQNSECLILADMRGSTDGLNQRQVGEPLPKLEKLSRDVVILVAGREPAPLMSLVRSSWSIAPRQILGTAPVALASVWRKYLGNSLRCSPQDLTVSLLGAPPQEGLYQVVASVAAQPVENFLSIPELRRVAEQVSRRSCPGSHTLATAAVNTLHDMVRKDGAVYSCYVWADGAYGARGLFLCAPAVLGPWGLERLLDVRLDPAHRVIVDRSVDYLARVQGQYAQ